MNKRQKKKWKKKLRKTLAKRNILKAFLENISQDNPPRIIVEENDELFSESTSFL